MFRKTFQILVVSLVPILVLMALPGPWDNAVANTRPVSASRADVLRLPIAFSGIKRPVICYNYR
jgi:hypothetical protein